MRKSLFIADSILIVEMLIGLGIVYIVNALLFSDSGSAGKMNRSALIVSAVIVAGVMALFSREYYLTMYNSAMRHRIAMRK